MGKIEQLILEFCADSNLRAEAMLPPHPLSRQVFNTLNPKEQEGFNRALDNLVTLGYLIKEHGDYFLSNGGFHHIYDDDFAKNRFAYPRERTSMTQNIHIHGSSGIQIGDDNQMQIAAQLNQLAEAIEKAEAPEADKQEAKSRLRALAENPLISGLLSGVGSSGLVKFLGLS